MAWVEQKEIKPGCTYWYLRVPVGSSVRSIYCGKSKPTLAEIERKIRDVEKEIERKVRQSGKQFHEQSNQ